jgi:hypothetical protein
MGPAVTSPDVDILVSVSGGPDFQCADPSDDISFLALHSQSLEEDLHFQTLEEDVSADDAAAPVGQPENITGMNTNISSNLGKVFFGETVVSLRPLLKRFNRFMRVTPAAQAYKASRIVLKYSAFPFNRGNVEGAVTGVIGGSGYNYVNTTMLNYLSFAYVGYRGSIRWKIMPFRADVTVSRDQYGGEFSYSVNDTINTSSMSTADALAVSASEGLQAFMTGATGSHVACQAVTPTAEIEMPFYTKKRFLLCRKEDRTSSAASEEDDADGVDVSAIASYSTTPPSLDLFVAGGDDFSVHFYVGPPPLFFDWDPPDVQ